MASNVDSAPQEPALKVDLLEQSFEKVKPQANAFAGSFYDNLFADYPAAQPLFANTDVAEQSKKLLASLVFVVENLRKPGALTEALKGLGARHVKYGALPEHYPLVGNTLLKTFEQYLGNDWTPATQQAWVDAYGVITEVMLEGADYSQDDVQLTTPEDEVDEATGLKVALLEQSFEQVKPHANVFAGTFYENLFADYPDAKPLFANTNVAEQSKKLLASLVFVVENLRKPGALTEALKGLGARHVKYGALPEHYPLVGNTLLKTFGQYLGADWTPSVKQAWVDAYGVITEVMLDGADYSQEDVQLAAAEDEVDEATGLKVALLEQSFEKVKPQANAFASSFYENLFTDYPAAKPLFANTNVAEQSKKLLASLVFVVENLRKPGALTEALKGLGARHVKYGALPEHYPLVGNTLLKTFEQYLGADWTPNVKQAWVDAYGVITEVMLEGADYSPDAVQLESSPSQTVEVPESNIKTGTAAGLIGGGLVVLIIMLFLI